MVGSLVGRSLCRLRLFEPHLDHRPYKYCSSLLLLQLIAVFYRILIIPLCYIEYKWSVTESNTTLNGVVWQALKCCVCNTAFLFSINAGVGLQFVRNQFQAM